MRIAAPGHGDRAPDVEQPVVAFILEVCHRAPAGGVVGCQETGLNHEIGHYPVEDQAVVEPSLQVGQKIRHCLGRLLPVEFHHDASHARLEHYGGRHIGPGWLHLSLGLDLATAALRSASYHYQD